MSREVYDPDHRRYLAHQHQVMRRGLHPLSISLHTDIGLHAQAAVPEPGEPGLRCGDCAHRTRKRQPDGARHVKCALEGRATDDARNDLRSWWPACPDYKPKARGRRT